ncbi:MAG: FAD-dependent monooxygenase [Alphaproteobacteria bacterium]
MLRNIAIIGGGPAGLFLAVLMRKWRPDLRVAVYEQNTPDATYGFGIAIKRRILDRFARYDAESIERMRPHLVTYDHQIISLNGQPIRVDYADQSASIERLKMLASLQETARNCGVELVFGKRIEKIDELASRFDLLIGADGANSVVREALRDELQTESGTVRNPLAWYGTSRVFGHSGLSFRRAKEGNFIAHYYPYSPERSTFVVECDEITWRRTVERLSQDDRTSMAESIFAEELKGHSLIDNKSIWRRLVTAFNKKWFFGNCVLIGDALRPAHPSIGSGTRLAMDDAIALYEALVQQPGDLSVALAAYQESRQASRAKLNDAMARSYRWYEAIDEKLDMAPEEFVLDYLTRTGRVDATRLERDYPAFMRQYRAFLDKTGVRQATEA